MTAAGPVEPLHYSEGDAATALGPGWKEIALRAHGWMALGRALDARMQGLQRQGRVGFYGAATGQEAVNVAAGLISLPNDWVFPGLREQLVALVRGHALPTYVHHLFGDARDPARGRNMPCHPSAREVHYVSMSSVIGTQISHAVGTAYGLRRDRSGGVAFAFFGDGATSSNDFHAGLNFAGVFGLPVLFCCTNNQWAISIPVERQSHVATLAEKSKAYGFRGERVDGTDFVAVYGSLATALGRIRGGGGPELLEFLLYRMTPHSSSDDPGRYQPADWAARARAHDPVDRLDEWLTRLGLLSVERKRAIAEESETAVRAAIQEAESTPLPPPGSVTEDVYSSALSVGVVGGR
ncbi:MAG: thiamine pyrophosphate-dependent enzyme [Thermoplasmata archaeon]